MNGNIHKINKEKKMNENVETQKDDEISLLDLFTVLLRYRKLIACITVFFIILSIAGYFIYPAYQYKKDKVEVQTEGIMQMEIVYKAQSYVSQPLDNFILHPEVIYNSLYAAGMEKFVYKGRKVSLNDENKQNVMYLINMLWVRNFDLDGNILILKGQEHKKTFNVMKIGTSPNTSPIFEITLKDKDPIMIKKFMESIYKSCSVSVEENLRINAQVMVTNYERFMNMSNLSESMKMVLEKDFETYVFLKDFLDGKEVAVKLVNEPVFIESFISLSSYKNRYFKKGIIIISAGFFLAVMIAFMLNAVRNIKNDDEAMMKIRDAMGNSGAK
jgi:LPS O-antigen subunit length determinant protein (WzzB/FepE family)